MKPARKPFFARCERGWHVRVGEGGWVEVDIIELEGCLRVRLPSEIVDDEEGEAVLPPSTECEVVEVEDPAYPSGVKRVLVCRPESGR